MKRHLILFFVILCLLPLNNADARQVAKIQSLTAHVNDLSQCRPDIELTVKAPDRSFFEGDKMKVKRLVSSALENLKSECQKYNYIYVVGYVGETRAYLGTYTKKNGWRLVDTIPSGPEKTDKITVGKDNLLTIYQDKNLIIKGPTKKYAPIWCKGQSGSRPRPHEMRAFYIVHHFERDPLFSPSYEAFVEKNIVPQIEDYCGKCPTEIKLCAAYNNHRTQNFDCILFKVVDGQAIRTRYLKPRGSFRAKNTDDLNRYKEFVQRMSPSKTDKKKLSAGLRRQPLFSDELVKVYAHGFSVDDARWARKRELDLVYNFEHNERNKKINHQYLARILFPILRQHGDIKSDLTVYYHKEGEKDYWDIECYSFRGLSYNLQQARDVIFQWRKFGKRAQQKRYDEEVNYGGGCDVDGPFCELQGGKILNAIYRNDSKLLASHGDSFLAPIANQYMYNSGRDIYIDGRSTNHERKSLKCLGTNIRKKTFKVTVPITQFRNAYGWDMGSVGGNDIFANYYVKSEFYPLLLRVGDIWGGYMEKDRAQMRRLSGLIIVLKGAERLQATYKCDSPDVLQFEKNLISLTTKYLDEKDTY